MGTMKGKKRIRDKFEKRFAGHEVAFILKEAGVEPSTQGKQIMIEQLLILIYAGNMPRLDQ